jgi:hypothetical protein
MIQNQTNQHEFPDNDKGDVTMDGTVGLKEWTSREQLPGGFVEWLNFIVRILAVEQGKDFVRIANDLGISPRLLSRWLAGKGPLTQENIDALAENLGHSVFTTLGLPLAA